MRFTCCPLPIFTSLSPLTPHLPPHHPPLCLLAISSICRFDFSLSTPSPPFASNSSISPAPYIQTLMERARRGSTLLLESGVVACVLAETGRVLSAAFPPPPCFQFEKWVKYCAPISQMFETWDKLRIQDNSPQKQWCHFSIPWKLFLLFFFFFHSHHLPLNDSVAYIPSILPIIPWAISICFSVWFSHSLSCPSLPIRVELYTTHATSSLQTHSWNISGSIYHLIKPP